MDLTDEDQVKSVVARLKPAVVVNCAAMASLGRCEKVPDQAASINAVGDAAAAACRCHCVSLTKHYGLAPACVSAQGAQSVIADSAGRPHVNRLRVWPGHVGLLCGGSCHRCTDNSVCAPNQLVSCRTPTHIVGLGRYGCTKAKFEAELGASWPRHVILRSSNIIGPPPPIASLPGPKFLQWLHGALSGSGTWRRQRGVLCRECSCAHVWRQQTWCRCLATKGGGLCMWKTWQGRYATSHCMPCHHRARSHPRPRRTTSVAPCCGAGRTWQLLCVRSQVVTTGVLGSCHHAVCTFDTGHGHVLAAINYWRPPLQACAAEVAVAPV